jgi:hypothetical protein
MKWRAGTAKARKERWLLAHAWHTRPLERDARARPHLGKAGAEVTPDLLVEPISGT